MSNVLMAFCLLFVVIIIYNKIKLFRQKKRKKKMQENLKGAPATVKKKTSEDYFTEIMAETMKN